MNTIWKFPFEVVDELTLTMPYGSRILTVQMQGEQPCLWALVNPSNSPDLRDFRIFGTGHPVPEDVGPYIGTFQLHGGALVFHMFESTPR